MSLLIDGLNTQNINERFSISQVSQHSEINKLAAQKSNPGPINGLHTLNKRDLKSDTGKLDIAGGQKLEVADTSSPEEEGQRNAASRYTFRQNSMDSSNAKVQEEEKRKGLQTYPEARISPARRTNISKAAEIRDFVQKLQPFSQDPALSPSQREAKLARQYLGAIQRQQEYRMDDIKELESITDKILTKSRATRGGLKSKSCERDREHRSVPRLSDIRLFKDIEKTDEVSTPLHLESFDNHFV